MTKEEKTKIKIAKRMKDEYEAFKEGPLLSFVCDALLLMDLTLKEKPDAERKDNKADKKVLSS